MPNIRVGDVNLSLMLPPGKWEGVFSAATGKTMGSIVFYYGKIPLEYHEPTINLNKKKITLCCQIDNDQYPLFSIHELKRNLAFLACLISSKYSFIHGAGFVLENKGVLLIGGSNSGKTTLISLFSNAHVIDEDILLTDGKTMERASFGTKPSYNGTEKMLSFKDEIYKSNIDIIFVLNNLKTPRIPKLINKQELSHDLTFDDRLPKTFYELYKEKPRVKFFSPIYELGTKNDPPKSKDIIESLIHVKN